MNNIGRAILKLRKDLGYSQIELSTLAGITQGYLSKIERESKIPTIENLENISKALSIPVSLITYIAESFSKKPKGRFQKLMDRNLQIYYSYIVKSNKYNKKSKETDSLLKKANQIEKEYDSILLELESMKGKPVMS